MPALTPISPANDVPAETAPPRAAEPHDPSLYFNRELSWLEFDARVLEEARDPALPVL